MHVKYLAQYLAYIWYSLISINITTNVGKRVNKIGLRDSYPEKGLLRLALGWHLGTWSLGGSYHSQN